MGELADLKGLGPKSEKCLWEIGIKTRADLEEMGAVSAFLKLKNDSGSTPSLNFLYALVGALENRHWQDIARQEKGRLLLELDGYEDLKKLLKADGIDL